MDDELDPLLIDIRANTAGFAADIARMRSSFDGQLLDGFGRAGDVLERGLLSAIRKGSLGFEDLKRVALGALDQIAGQALQLGLDRVMGSGGKSGGIGGVLEPMQANPSARQIASAVRRAVVE